MQTKISICEEWYEAKSEGGVWEVFSLAQKGKWQQKNAQQKSIVLKMNVLEDKQNSWPDNGNVK